MIRKLVKEQLENCSFANLTNYDETTNTFIIKKYTKPKYDLNKCYLVKVASAIVNNPNSVIAANWNNNTFPTASYLKIFISKTLGKMIYVDSVAYDFEKKCDINVMWSGWLPVEELTQISSL